MKRNLQLIAVTSWALLCSAQAGTPSGDRVGTELDRIQVMQKELDRTELWTFLDTTKTEGWSVPWIHSDYWVGRLPDEPEERPKLERAKRAFGLSIAKALDAEALRIVQPTDSKAREDQAKRLLDAADWLGQSRGYGNLLLVTRTENLAYVPIGHLVADLNYPTNSIDSLLKRVSTPEEDLAFRLAVLDEEAPAPIAVARTGSVKDVAAQIDIAWSRKVNKVATWCKEHGVGFPEASKHRAIMPPEYAFFADDEVSTPPYTTVNKWNEKQHKSFCVYGGVKGIRQRVETLYLFRLNVESFPTNPPAWFGPQEKKYTAIEAAFTQTWGEPLYSIYGPIGQSAGRVYEAILVNRLMDWDTAQIVNTLERAKAK